MEINSSQINPAPVAESKASTPISAAQITNPQHQKKNLYPAVRHILLVICVLFALAFIVFLMHQNGKSIYDNGI